MVYEMKSYHVTFDYSSPLVLSILIEDVKGVFRVLGNPTYHATYVCTLYHYRDQTHNTIIPFLNNSFHDTILSVIGSI